MESDARFRCRGVSGRPECAPRRFFSRSIERNANHDMTDRFDSSVDASDLSSRCPKCDERIASVHVCDSLDAPKKCPLCADSFGRLSSFVRHVSGHGGGSVFVCDACGAFFAVKSKLARHMLTHSGVKPYGCSLCDARFNNACSLRKHGVVHSGLKPHKCDVCGKAFGDSSNLNKHVLKHKGLRYACPDCGKQYKMKWSLTIHAKSHSNDASWVCSLCPKTFYTKKDKMRHEITHTNLRQFTCAWCKTATHFRRKDNLDRHVRNAHADVRGVAKSSESAEENRLRILEANNLRESVIIKSHSEDKRRTAEPRETVEAPRVVESSPATAIPKTTSRFDSDTLYIHKKVHYDIKKYSDFDDEKARRCIDRFSSSSKSDGGDAKVSFSPDTIELYKKILCPSYVNDV